ncbi:beta-N-acetylhexosaminidase [Silvibacterium acidisoli]|uniref:beta-N-acetylhexosaminidase n=1 Tax=Acidobacteriaceae bacterium ZG23-2 TaxID=2883246 RepID=UPI00406D14B7
MLAGSIAATAKADELNLMPWPSHIEQQAGALNLNRLPHVEVTGCEERVTSGLDRFNRAVALRTGMPFLNPDLKPDTATMFAIHCAAHGDKVQALEEDESYKLTVTAAGIDLSAPNPLGVLHGFQTLLQLMHNGPQGWEIPAVQIEDTPRFPWRGLMIDVSRHFMGIDVLKRNIDGMEAVKYNVLHLHLSDDEGFRVQSLKRPKLTEVASDGNFYTQEQVRDLVEYARARGIRVVPEFDVPGHSVSWLVAYPELASAPGVTKIVRSQYDELRPPFDPTNDGTYKLLDDVFGEMAKLFPDEYFHIGGDEVDGKYWDHNEKIQAWMKEHNIKDNHALQAYFNQKIQKIVNKHGKHMEGWDEIVASDLPKDILVQSWRGPKSIAQTAQMGFKTLLSAGYYLDLQYSAATHYAVDPLEGEAAALTPEQKKLIIGGEAAQWTEYVTSEILDNRIWPRAGAVAERLWSPESVTDVNSMYRRLAVLSDELQWVGLEHTTSSQRMLDRIAAGMPYELFNTLAVTVEPVKEYERETTQKYDTNMPLNHLVDADPPESNEARRINALATQAASNAEARAELRKWLVRWRDNDAKIEPYLATSELRTNLVPLSQQLAVLGTVGLQALDAIESGHALTADQQKQQNDSITAADVHHAQMLIVVVPAVKSLVAAEPVAH